MCDGASSSKIQSPVSKLAIRRIGINPICEGNLSVKIHESRINDAD